MCQMLLFPALLSDSLLMRAGMTRVPMPFSFKVADAAMGSRELE